MRNDHDWPLPLYSAAQVHELDARLIAAGTPGFELMQRAAHAAWRALRQRWPQGAAVTVLAGAGNNAGDGYLIAELAQVNVITSNCPDYAISDGEWTLITGSGDRLAARLGLDAAGYERTYFAPAFELLDDPAACDRVGPAARPLIERLKSMGGDTVPLTQSQ